MSRTAGIPAIDWKAFSRKIFEPDRGSFEDLRAVAVEVTAPHLAAARKKAGGALDAAAKVAVLTSPVVCGEVWETLTSRLDASWAVDDADRSFLPFAKPRKIEIDGPKTAKDRWSWKYTPQHLASAPWNVETMLAFLSSPKAQIRDAEEAAKEAVERMRPFGARALRRVAWILLDPATWPAADWMDCWSWASEALWWNTAFRSGGWNAARAIEAQVKSTLIDAERSSRSAPRDNAVRSAGHDGASWWGWQWAAERDLAIEPHDYPFGFPASAFGLKYADLPNPFDPVMRIWGHGFAPVDIQGDVIVLGLPWVHGEPVAPSLGAAKKQLIKGRAL